MDWSNIELKVYAAEGTTKATGKIYLPNGTQLYELSVLKNKDAFELESNPISNQTKFNIKK
jgi:alpha-D-xyloside xylohydrolase